MEKQLSFDLDFEPQPVSAHQTASPSGYKGLYRFHKYWGKKPHEPLAYAIERLTAPSEVVFDPFMGSGTTGREALLRSRRFVGFDINPIAAEITRLLIRPPAPETLRAAFHRVEMLAKQEILQSYRLEDGKSTATHYLWEGEQMSRVWVVGRGSVGRRREFAPTAHDLQLSDSFGSYTSKYVRQPRFFDNSRINASPSMRLCDVLCGRAQRNIDLLIDAIHRCPDDLVPALNLCLTAASGQMTRMVFAVTGRGKTTGKVSDKIEVGSWVIGFWRPKLHFEVNVWNCFHIRASALLKAIKDNDPLASTNLTSSLPDLLAGRADALIECGDCRTLLDSLPDECVQLVVTDPPHSDRIPYLELSELWNSILNASPDFEKELVISNAREREKSPESYLESLHGFLDVVPRVLRPHGTLVVFFNARQEDQWAVFRSIYDAGRGAARSCLRYAGYFPCAYSTGSVVQDNRAGSLKTDCALVFTRPAAKGNGESRLSALANIPGWSHEFPKGLINGGTT